MPDSPGAPLPPPPPQQAPPPVPAPPGATGGTGAGPAEAPPRPVRSHRVQVRPGDLTLGWRGALVATWVGVFVAYLAVWKASEEMGIHTWWLGPRADPQPLVVRMLPFAIAVVMGTVAGSQLRRLPLISLGGAVVLAAIAVPDLPIAVGLALVEFTIAASVALVALASFTGLYRAAPGGDSGER